MSDENHASYAKTGFTVMLGTLAIIATLVYLGGAGGRGNLIMAETYFDAAISGLSVGSEVDYRGVAIGSVSDISFVGALYDDAAEGDWEKVVVTISIDGRKLRLADCEDAEERLSYLIQKGLRATVSASGITGLSKMDLNIPKDPVGLQPISWEPRHLCIPPQPSVLENITDMISRVMNEIDDMDFSGAFSNFTAAAGSVAALSSDIDGFVESQKGAVAGAVANISEAAASIRALADEIRENPSILLRTPAREQ